MVYFPVAIPAAMVFHVYSSSILSSCNKSVKTKLVETCHLQTYNNLERFLNFKLG